MKSVIPKQFIELHGKPILIHTIQKFFETIPDATIIVVIAKEYEQGWETLCKQHQFSISHTITVGGATRYESVKNGLELVPDGAVVGIHDAARPLVVVGSDGCRYDCLLAGHADRPPRVVPFEHDGAGPHLVPLERGGRRDVVGTLAERETLVVVDADVKFGRGDLTDLEWIEALSKEGGWIVFSGDRRITKNKAERDAFKKARLTGFFIGKALLKKGPVQQVYRLLHQWDKIEKIASAVDDGATYEVTETKIKQI